MEIKVFLIKNYIKLSQFLNINLFPANGLSWSISYKKKYSELDEEQKKLSDKLSDLMRKNI